MKALDLIAEEIDRQSSRVDAAAREAMNTRNDRIAIAIAYLGRAGEHVLRNEREGQNPVENLVKAAAVLVAAIDAEVAA